MSNVDFRVANAEQEQAITSLVSSLESGRATFSSEGSILFDVLSGRTAELVVDGATSGAPGSIDATIWTEDTNNDPVEIAKVRITVAVLS